jgi:hypothetical protein
MGKRVGTEKLVRVCLRRKIQIENDLEGSRRRWENEKMKGLNCKTIVKACFPHFMCFTLLVDTYRK